MKKLTLLFLLLAFGCKEKNDKPVTAKKEIAEKEHIRKNEVILTLNDSSQDFSTNLRFNELQDKPDIIELGKDVGRNSISIPTERNFRILGGNPLVSFFYELNVEKGDSVEVFLDSVSLHGNTIRIPSFKISNSNRSWQEINFENILYKLNLGTGAIEVDSSKSFLYTITHPDHMYKNAMAALDSLAANHLISSEFYNTQKEHQKIERAIRKVRQAARRHQKLDPQNLGIVLDDKNKLEDPDYITFLKTVIDYKFFDPRKHPANSTKFDFVFKEANLLNKEAKLAVLDSYLKSILISEHSRFKGYLKKFISIDSDSIYLEKWQSILKGYNESRIQENLENHNIGQLENLADSRKYTFEEVLGKQKGKLVLVDFWASWCAPCRKEIPLLKKLRKEFIENNFQVISISIDEDVMAWKRALEIENIGNEENSYIISQWEKSNLYKNYHIQSIPRYLLFDKTGKIITADAPRPGTPELEELIKADL